VRQKKAAPKEARRESGLAQLPQLHTNRSTGNFPESIIRVQEHLFCEVLPMCKRLFAIPALLLIFLATAAPHARDWPTTRQSWLIPTVCCSTAHTQCTSHFTSSETRTQVGRETKALGCITIVFSGIREAGRGGPLLYLQRT